MRACGSCSACCTVMSVHEIAKGMYEACEHLCGAGCGIYAERPGACRTFECQWLRGVYTACEVERGASGSGHAQAIIKGLEERFLVMIVTPSRDGEKGPGERSFVGPRHLVTRATAVLWSRPAGQRGER